MTLFPTLSRLPLPRGVPRGVHGPAAVIGAILVLLAGLSASRADPPGPTQSPTETIDGHPALARSPRYTMTAKGIQGDAINVAFIGTEEELHRMFAAAGWYAADPITLKTSARIAADVVLRKPYAHAPVSDLYVWGRRQDAAFEQPVGESPSSGITCGSGVRRNWTAMGSRSGSVRRRTTSGSN
jgi:hypothetical protein